MSEDTGDFERYFRDPKTGDQVLGIGSTGIACKNIRLGLRVVGFHPHIDFSETYDTALAHEVLRFQEALGHTSRDGQFGPGTRRLLTRAVLEASGDSPFKRMTDPEQRAKGQVFVSYSRSDAEKVRHMIARIRAWGFSVWFDDRIDGGEHFNVSIQHAIESCFLVLASLSETATKSMWVEKEIIFATGCGKDIVPIKLEPLPVGHPLKLVLINHQMLDFESPDFMQRLKSAISGAHAKLLAT